VRIVKTIGDKVISKLRFYNTFNYLGYERDTPCEFVSMLSRCVFSHSAGDSN